MVFLLYSVTAIIGYYLYPQGAMCWDLNRPQTQEGGVDVEKEEARIDKA